MLILLTCFIIADRLSHRVEYKQQGTVTFWNKKFYGLCSLKTGQYGFLANREILSNLSKYERLPGE